MPLDPASGEPAVTLKASMVNALRSHARQALLAAGAGVQAARSTHAVDLLWNLAVQVGVRVEPPAAAGSL